jgi:N-acetylneuraminate synthase/N,N'-diacetyllegionaminate synthase
VNDGKKLKVTKSTHMNRSLGSIQVGAQRIGPGEPCFIAAEIGINHNGDMDLAKQSIDAAAEAGVDGVKFQNYVTEDFLSDRSALYSYQSQGKEVTEPQYDMFKRCELSFEQLAELRSYCASKGVVFFSTPTSAEGVDVLRKLETPLLKNGSDYLSHLALIRHMAASGIPTVLSTGMATASEIDAAVSAFRGAGGRELILLHCTSCYPTPAEQVNLRKIAVMAEAFACPVGFSDHTCGNVAALGAVAMGAGFIEKHFTLDRNLPGPDHCFSSTPEEMAQLVQDVRYMEKAFGSGALGPAAGEKDNRESFRLSCTIAADLPEGHVLEENDISYRRPGYGVPPAHVEYLLGRRTLRPLGAGTVVSLNDLA